MEPQVNTKGPIRTNLRAWIAVRSASMKVLRTLAPILAALVAGLFAPACSSSTSAAGSGAACSTDNDCPADTFCTWPITNACGQKGKCAVPPADTSTCTSGPHACPCDGSMVQQATCGSFSVPVTGSLGCLQSACTPGQTTCNAGLVCLDSICQPPLEAGASPDASAAADASPAKDAAAD